MHSRKIVAVSGGFDPLHPGHLDFFREALKHGDCLHVIVDCDERVARKHRLLQRQEDRAKLVAVVREVSNVWLGGNPDTVGDVLRKIKPDVYCVGPDYLGKRFPEIDVCEEINTKVICLSNLRKMSSTAIAGWDNPPVCASAIITQICGKVLIGLHADGPDLPGGFVEVGESLEDAVQREAREEAGVGLEDCRYEFSLSGLHPDGRRILVAYFSALTPDEPKGSSEINSWRWVSVGDLPGKMRAEVDHRALARYFKLKGVA